MYQYQKKRRMNEMITLNQFQTKTKKKRQNVVVIGWGTDRPAPLTVLEPPQRATPPSSDCRDWIEMSYRHSQTMLRHSQSEPLSLL